MQVPETHYARSADGLRLAYQLWGEGPPFLIVPPLLSNIEVSWEHPAYRRVQEYMGRHLTCAMFDKRGVGLSVWTRATPRNGSRHRRSSCM